MRIYLDLLDKILKKGYPKSDRTKVGTLSLFGEKMEFDLSQGFPLLTTKRIYMKGVIAELLWFLRGDTNIDFLQKNNCHIWDEWADENGSLGPIYGKQWRAWQGDTQEHDQIKNLLTDLANNPTSRRLLLNAWNVACLPTENMSPQENVANNKMALAPCHVLAQFYVNSGGLSCQVYLRSQDFFLGTPFNVASYALLTHILALELNLKPDRLIWIAGDVHLYLNHLEQAKLQLTRQPKKLPKLVIKNRPADVFSYNVDDFLLVDYNPDKGIKAPIAV